LTLAEGRPYNLTIHTLKFELAFCASRLQVRREEAGCSGMPSPVTAFV